MTLKLIGNSIAHHNIWFSMEKGWLFTYGTFQDPEIQEILFGSTRTTRKASLVGWSVFAADEDGYLFIKPDSNGIVHGSVMELKATDLPIADRWEDVPFYKREKVIVKLENDIEMEAWAYSRRQANGTPYSGDRYSLKDRETVLAIARASKKHR